jgi:hypothetical protein
MLRRVRLILDVQPGTNADILVRWSDHTMYHGPAVNHVEWDIDASVWGDLDLELDISGQGCIVWQDLHMNYTGCLLCLPGSESSGGQRVMPRDFYSPPSLAPDCRSDVWINGHAVIVHRGSEYRGAWHYDITAPARVQARIRIDRQKTMLWTPVI